MAWDVKIGFCVLDRPPTRQYRSRGRRAARNWPRHHRKPNSSTSMTVSHLAIKSIFVSLNNKRYAPPRLQDSGRINFIRYATSNNSTARWMCHSSRSRKNENETIGRLVGCRCWYDGRSRLPWLPNLIEMFSSLAFFPVQFARLRWQMTLPRPCQRIDVERGHLYSTARPPQFPHFLPAPH